MMATMLTADPFAGTFCEIHSQNKVELHIAPGVGRLATQLRLTARCGKFAAATQSKSRPALSRVTGGLAQ